MYVKDKGNKRLHSVIPQAKAVLENTPVTEACHKVGCTCTLNGDRIAIYSLQRLHV